MRNRPIGLVSAMMLVGAVATVGCSSSSGGGTGGTGGTAGHGGSGGAGGGGGTSSGGGTGGGGAGGGSGVTTLNGTTAVNALTTAQATQLCDDTHAYFGNAIPKATTCKWKGLTYAATSSAPSQSVLQQNCTSQDSACESGGDPWAATFSFGCSDIPTSCTATVAEYSACISDEVTAFGQVVNGFPACSALATSDVSPIMDAEAGGTPPASCASLSNKCPDLTPPNPLNIQ